MSSEARVIGYCRMCGKALEENGATAAEGTLYCAEHAPRTQASSGAGAWAETSPSGASARTQEHPPLYAAASPYTPSQPPPLPKADDSVSPPLAFILGFIPGV